MANKSFLTSDELDFDNLKESFITYLQGQDQFSDYDFEGSNLSTLIDLLTYNTYLNSLYLNQIGSEMFLDTALLRDSVVSHAKELNYVPASMISSTANIDIIVNTGISNVDLVPATVTIPDQFEMSTTVGDNTYTFTTEGIRVLSDPLEGSDGVFRFFANNLIASEGDIITETFVANITSNTSIGFKISSANVDISSIRVNVQNSNTDTTNTSYERRESLLGLTPTDNIFFIEGADDFKYKVVFGNGINGRAIENGNVIKVNYRNAHGDEPNGANTFTSAELVNGYSVSVNTNEKAQLGTVTESTDSIKFNAPRYFATQGRAVTADDYKSIIRSNFNQYQTVTVYGGEDDLPPRYGKVVVVIKPSNNRPRLNDTEKNQIVSFLRPRTPLSIDPVVKDAEFNYVKLSANVSYNISVTTQSAADIESKVRTSITNFDTNNLGDFGSILRYSKLSSAIDEADPSILGNEIYLSMYRDIQPVPNIIRTVNYSYENKLDSDEAEGCISSTAFTFEGQACSLDDDGNGNIRIITVQAGTEVVLVSNAGTVNYNTGEVTLQDFVVSSFEGSSLRIFALPELRDIISTRNIILNIGEDEIGINVIGLVG